MDTVYFVLCWYVDLMSICFRLHLNIHHTYIKYSIFSKEQLHNNKPAQPIVWPWHIVYLNKTLSNESNTVYAYRVVYRVGLFSVCMLCTLIAK